MPARDSELELIIVSDVEHYRLLAQEKVLDRDLVLEIGCSTGQTTSVLASQAARVVAVDCSAEILDKAQAHLAGCDNVELARVDARDLAGLTELAPAPDAIFLDIGGIALLDNVAGRLRQCLRMFQPRVIVVRSHELAELVSLVSEVHPPDEPSLRPPRQDGRERALEALLDLSRSSVVNSRMFAVRKLGHLDAPAAAERLAEMANDPSRRVRRAVERCGRPISNGLRDCDERP